MSTKHNHRDKSGKSCKARKDMCQNELNISRNKKNDNDNSCLTSDHGRTSSIDSNHDPSHTNKSKSLTTPLSSFLQFSVNPTPLKKFIRDAISEFRNDIESSIIRRFENEMNGLRVELDELREDLMNFKRDTTIPSKVVDEHQPIEIVEYSDDENLLGSQEPQLEQKQSSLDQGHKRPYDEDYDCDGSDSSIDDLDDPDYKPNSSQITSSTAYQWSQATYTTSSQNTNDEVMHTAPTTHDANHSSQDQHQLSPETRESIDNIILSRRSMNIPNFSVIYLIEAEDVKNMRRVLDIVGRGKKVTYFVEWITGLKKWIRPLNNMARDQFRQLRLSFWREHNEKRKRQAELGIPFEPRNTVQKPISYDIKKPKIKHQKMRTNGLSSCKRSHGLAQTVIADKISGNNSESISSGEFPVQADQGDDADDYDDNKKDADFNADSIDDEDDYSSDEFSSSDCASEERDHGSRKYTKSNYKDQQNNKNTHLESIHNLSNRLTNCRPNYRPPKGFSVSAVDHGDTSDQKSTNITA